MLHSHHARLTRGQQGFLEAMKDSLRPQRLKTDQSCEKFQDITRAPLS